MTFLVRDSVRVAAGTVTIGGHLLDLAAEAGRVSWRLQCRSCLAVLAVGSAQGCGPLLAGSRALPASSGRPAVSWAWGTPPPGAGRVLQVVFARGLRRPAVAAGHVVAEGLWIGAVPGRARRAIALGAGLCSDTVTDPLPAMGCPAALEELAAGSLRRVQWGRRP